MLYFSEKLLRKLDGIPAYPLTILDAPSGFGKTTAVTEYLKKRDMNTLYLTAAQGDAHFWDELCSLVSELNLNAGETLKLQGPVNSANFDAVLAVLRGIVPCEETYFVLDDYHLVENEYLTKLFLELFCKPEATNHLVVLTQSICYTGVYDLVIERKLNYITKSDLVFSKNDFIAYYKLCGVMLSEQEQNDLYRYTEGWVAALYLQMLAYQQQEQLEPHAGIGTLIKTAVLDKLSADRQLLLYYLCRFDGFTFKQAVYMVQESDSAEIVAPTLDNCALIRYDYHQNKYIMHELLRQFLLHKLDKQPAAFQTAVTHRMACWYAEQREYVLAIFYFYELHEFDEILSLPMVALDIVRVLNKQTRRLILDIMKTCPVEIKQKYPRGLLIMAFGLLTYNEMQAFYTTTREFYWVISRNTNLNEREKNHLKGEMAFILSLAQYNNISKMSKLHRRAYELLGGPLTILSLHGPWTFGSPSVLYMFYCESGKLDAEQACMDECLPYYYKLSGGHGAGAEEAMRAEILFNRGDFNGARIACHRADYMAQEKEQNCIYLCTVLLQARIAIVTNDVPTYREQLDHIHKLMPTALGEGLTATIDLCEGALFALLGHHELAANWILSGDFDDNHLQFFVVPYANIVYARILLLSGNDEKLLGLSKPLLSLGAIFPNLIAQIYTHIFTAAAYYRLGYRKEARSTLSEALRLAMPDRLYMPFAENGDFIDRLLQDLQQSGSFKQEIACILQLAEQHRAGAAKVNASLFGQPNFGLTERELEVALLAAQRLSNKEIAAKLFISENTVKFNLKAIYQKLYIKSRRDLVGIISPLSQR